jgi:hypothetical protein
LTNEEHEWLQQFTFAKSRIPKLDALSVFVPHGGESDPTISEQHARVGFSRWFPVEGGHRVLFPYEGGDFDASRFSIEHEAWDHETCKICRAHIPSMTLCWVTQDGPYVILCSACQQEL